MGRSSVVKGGEEDSWMWVKDGGKASETQNYKHVCGREAEARFAPLPLFNK